LKNDPKGGFKAQTESNHSILEWKTSKSGGIKINQEIKRLEL